MANLFPTGGKPLLNKFGLFKKGTMFADKDPMPPEEDGSSVGLEDEPGIVEPKLPPPSSRSSLMGPLSKPMDTAPALDTGTNMDQEVPDDGGLPEKPKNKWYNTLLDILVPAAGSAFSGTGLIPGAAAGFIKHRDRQSDDYKDSLKAYLDQQRLTNDESYKKEKLGIDKKRLGIDEAKAAQTKKYQEGMLNRSTKTELERVAEAQARIDDAFNKGMDPDPNDYALIKLYNSKNGL